MNKVCRGIRGAITAEANTREAIVSATKELLQEVIQSNQVDKEDVAAIIFTTTRDLDTEFPALAARLAGWTDIALLCTHEMAVPGALPMCIRILMLVNTTKTAKELVHVYQKGAINLRSRGLDIL